MNSQRRGACFGSSPSFDEDGVSISQRLIAESLAVFRMSTMEQQNADRDRMWPRNYSYPIRAPDYGLHSAIVN